MHKFVKIYVVDSDRGLHSMDVSFNNVLEGTVRQYFMGLPKPAQESTGQQMWPSGASTEEGTPALSGAPTPSSRPPSAAAAPPLTAAPTIIAVPPRPPSEPLEPEPHIIHKATVMREAAEKRRERNEIEDEEENVGGLSPPSHIIRKPSTHTLPSPAPASAVPSPSPVRPPSAVSHLSTPAAEQADPSTQYRASNHRVQTPIGRPAEFANSRPADHHSISHPSETYTRYQYESSVVESGRNSHGPPIAVPQATAPRQSPQTYARISNKTPQHAVNRLTESSAHHLQVQRYNVPTQVATPHNDRVPPIHHPHLPSTKRLTPLESRAAQVYSSLPQRRETASCVRPSSQYERQAVLPQRKYDPQQVYSGYRPTSAGPQHIPNNRVESHHQVQYKHTPVDVVSPHYAIRPHDRVQGTSQMQSHDIARLPPRIDYVGKSRSVERSNYPYAAASTSSASSVRYAQNGNIPPVQNNSTVQSRSSYRNAVAPKTNYDFATSNHVQISPSRSTAKPGYPSQQARMTVSVTSIVNQMNQTKQKRESPLDLSVKTVKNSADSSTTQDDAIDSVSLKNDNLALQSRPTSSTRNGSVGYIASHKVDFSPDFAQYRERTTSQGYNSLPNVPPQMRYNGANDSPQPAYPVEPRHQVYADRIKYNGSIGRPDYVPRIDLTRPNGEDRYNESRMRDDRHLIIEERKRPTGPIVSNIPEKTVRYEAWPQSDRMERMSQSAREQHELMSRPVYSYTSHKKFEAYQSDHKRSITSNVYREQHSVHHYPMNMYPESGNREANDYHTHYHERMPNNRHIIQKIPSQTHRDFHPHVNHNNIHAPDKKKVLSILRNSLETKQTGVSETCKSTKGIPDLIVIDDVDDSVIEVTDLTKEVDGDIATNSSHLNIACQSGASLDYHIKMPKAVDSLPRDSDYQRFESRDAKTHSPENDVARIRTKAELKVMPPSHDSSSKMEMKEDLLLSKHEKCKPLPKSQKQHLFNQIREDNLRLESVIKNEKPSDSAPEVKSEPMNIDEIEKDAMLHIKSETNEPIINSGIFQAKTDIPVEEVDMDWANACDNFMEQLKVGCHKKKLIRKRNSTLEPLSENKTDHLEDDETFGSSLYPTESEKRASFTESTVIQIKKEPVDEEELKLEIEQSNKNDSSLKNKQKSKPEKSKNLKKIDKDDKPLKSRSNQKAKNKSLNDGNCSSNSALVKKEAEDEVVMKTVIKEELESTDDDEPLIKSKIFKQKQLEQSDNLNYQLLKDLSEKSAYVKLECCDDQMTSAKNSIDTTPKEEKVNKAKKTRQTKYKGKSSENTKKMKVCDDYSSDSDDTLSVANRLRVRKNGKTDEGKTSTTTQKLCVKSTPTKKFDSSSAHSSPMRKPGFGDGSDFHPGWEEELYRYKRSLRMPTRLIAIPRGRSGGPFAKGCMSQFQRGSTSLPDLDPVPLSPAPSSAPSAATDELYRRPDKLNLDSDLDSNSSCSAFNKLQYDSEASTSTVFSATKANKNRSSIVDVLIQKCGKREESKKKNKDKDDKTPKVMAKSSNAAELLPTPSLGLLKNGNKGNLSAKKEKFMEDIFYLGAFRKETVSMFRTAFIKETDGLIGATEEFAPVVLKSRTRTESRVLKQRATIKEIFGDDRPASAPPTSCREELALEKEEEPSVVIKKEPDTKNNIKPKKVKDKMKRRSSSIRDGLRSTKSLKTNDAKGRLMRLKKRNSLMKNFAHKRRKDMTNKLKKDVSSTTDEKDNSKEETTLPIATENTTKRRLKRLFGRRKFSSGFDYIRKKKKIIRREDNAPKIRRAAPKPSPESVHDIQKEIKSWFINKSIGETHLHRAARLGFTDCVAYCLEKMDLNPSAKDNAGFTPLHVASARGHVRIARLLLQYGANVSAAAQGGIRPLHEACENSHVEIIRLLLSYGADPLLGTYAGQTPEELAEGQSAKLLHLYIADVQGRAIEPWKFPTPAAIIDREELGCDPLSSPPPASPPPPQDTTIEIQCTEAPLPPFYSLRTATGQPADGLWCLLQDISNVLQIKSKDSLLKQIHCGSGSPRELLREIRTQEFLERAQCHQLLCAGEKVNVRASKVALIRVTDKLRQLLKIETVLVS
ncbi:unnamed protein product [Danaus chrysippus]|uniref:(African queen) hypothetical protein n=1 Tax=Danaus chrysippus TaxID=151541 RepID=A0A8J2VQ98_9NEOP|nr:unnamed protein product [Danaus chrysippus]